MLVFADKVITTEDSKQIKEWIMMTRNKELEFTKKMLHAGLSVKEVSGMMTVLTTQDVEKIAEKMDRVPNDSVH